MAQQEGPERRDTEGLLTAGRASQQAPGEDQPPRGRTFNRAQAAGFFALGLLVTALVLFKTGSQQGPEGPLRSASDFVSDVEVEMPKIEDNPCRLVRVFDGSYEMLDAEACADVKQMSPNCSKPGESCLNSRCCAWEGMRCYGKDDKWASCRWQCESGPDFSEEDFNWWHCQELGPRTPGKVTKEPVVEKAPAWVKDHCAAPGEDCSASRCCAEAGMVCYEKNHKWASCKWGCEPGVDLFDAGPNTWSCEEIGKRTPGEIKTPEPLALPDWVGDHCATDGEDCHNVGCCAQPGMQCFEKFNGYATCKASCTPGVDFHDMDSMPWTCNPIGPRTPGDAAEGPPPVKYADLPDWVASDCTDSGTVDCSKSQCCKDPNMQCFQKEDGWATCMERCYPGQDPNVDGEEKWSCKELGPKTPEKCPSCAPGSLTASDVVIPFFERDLCRLKYTAKSLAVNDPNNLLGDVYLCWVSDTPWKLYKDDIEEIKANIAESKTVIFLDFTGRMGDTEPTPLVGWHAQQVVKLKMASHVQTEYYMVMDSKNTIVRPIAPDTFFTSCNQGIIQAAFPGYDIQAPHADWYAMSAEALGYGKPDESSWWPASQTPVVLHRQTVLDMLEYLEEDPSTESLCNGPLCEKLGAFSKSGHGATEFTLYSLFAYGKRDVDGDDQFKCVHSVKQAGRFSVEHGDDWLKEVQKKLRDAAFPSDQSQITVSNKDGYPLSWTPASEGWTPPEDDFPLTFEDLTHSWSVTLWKGDKYSAGKLAASNLATLKDVVQGVRQFPVMLGAQPAAFEPMSTASKDSAAGALSQLFTDAKLYGGSGDLVGCVVGYEEEE